MLRKSTWRLRTESLWVKKILHLNTFCHKWLFSSDNLQNLNVKLRTVFYRELSTERRINGQALVVLKVFGLLITSICPLSPFVLSFREGHVERRQHHPAAERVELGHWRHQEFKLCLREMFLFLFCKFALFRLIFVAVFFLWHLKIKLFSYDCNWVIWLHCLLVAYSGIVVLK